MLCEITKKRSQWIWNRLKEAQSVGLTIGEESITDFFLLELKKSEKKGNYQINSFNKKEEGINGADWEIWLTGSSKQWLCLRVQAKILSPKNEYEQLHYKNGFQTAKLIEDAAKNNAVPLYCLYSYWDKNKFSASSTCLAASSNIKLFGASVLSATLVEEFQSKNIKKLTDVIHHLIPLSCLFCCGDSNQDLPTRALNYLTRQKIVNNNSFHLLTSNEIPSYAEKISKKQQTDSEIIIDDNTLARITVIVENNNELQFSDSNNRTKKWQC
jgi:hypothetical protein